MQLSNADVLDSRKTIPSGGIAMLIIDAQNDFHPPNGSLAVPNATADSEKIAAFLRTHQAKISQITLTLDSHQALHVAHAAFWINPQTQQPPEPFTLIKAQDIVDGKWKARRPDLEEFSLAYTKKLEANGRFVLCIWPEHCIIGTPGHNIVSQVHEEALAWSKKSLQPLNYVLKGTNCFTEHYSALRADVEIPSDPSTRLNTALLEQLKKADKVVICGEALSHCVNFTTRDLVESWAVEDRKKLTLLTDCSSSVPGFEKHGQDFVNDMKDIGIMVCQSQDFQS